ncbi:MAG: hypothetical protein LUD17_09865, partial [Bacteroidales bacterium]|nr:hypothetical protein [Bacteroidales bacterium]
FLAIIHRLNVGGNAPFCADGKFIEENPGWLAVDFTTKSIVAYRGRISYYQYWMGCTVSRMFYVNTEGDEYASAGEYLLRLEEYYSKTDGDPDMGVFQVAIVTDKLPSNATVKGVVNVHSTTE